MSLLPASSSFDYLIKQIQTDLSRAAELCEEVKTNRHVEPRHNNLDELKQALSAGLKLVCQEADNAGDLKGADADGGDAIARADFMGYVKQVEEIGTRLESIAFPITHHEHHHHHRHRTLFFPVFVQALHKEKEHPHFHELTLKWEGVRVGITRTFDDLRDRLAKKAADKKAIDDVVENEKKKTAEPQQKLDKEEEHQKEPQIEKEKADAQTDKEVEQVA